MTQKLAYNQTHVEVLFVKCPHCMTAFFDSPTSHGIGTDVDGYWNLVIERCPSCNRFILCLEQGALIEGQKISFPELQLQQPFRLNKSTFLMVRPKGITRPPCPLQVPDDIKKDYIQSCLVLADSPEASAALSRRCLQHVLHDRGFKSSNLAKEIDLVIQNGKLPSNIAENIDAVRNIGNFAAHPQKSIVAAEIFPVEPEEAEWNLDVLESLFDFFYVQPSIARKKREALNQKLQELGKPPMK